MDIPPKVPEQSESASPSEFFYVSHNRSLLALAVLCVGLLDVDGKMLFNPNKKPKKSMKKKKMVNLTTGNMKDEVKQQWDTFVASSLLSKEREKGALSTKYWDKKQLDKWLCDHPIPNINDVMFLRSIIVRLIFVKGLLK